MQSEQKRCRHSLVVMVFFSMSRQMGHISSLCRLRGDTAISVPSMMASWGGDTSCVTAPKVTGHCHSTLGTPPQPISPGVWGDRVLSPTLGTPPEPISPGVWGDTMVPSTLRTPPEPILGFGVTRHCPPPWGHSLSPSPRLGVTALLSPFPQDHLPPNFRGGPRPCIPCSLPPQGVSFCPPLHEVPPLPGCPPLPHPSPGRCQPLCVPPGCAPCPSSPLFGGPPTGVPPGVSASTPVPHSEVSRCPSRP